MKILFEDIFRDKLKISSVSEISNNVVGVLIIIFNLHFYFGYDEFNHKIR